MKSVEFTWKRFVTNGFRYRSNDLEYRRVYIINVSILLISCTLFIFGIYNIIVTGNHTLAAIEYTVFVLLIALLSYFHKTRNIRVTAYGVLILTFIILAAFTAIVENREYALYWIIVFPPLAIFLLGRKMGLCANALFLGYFLIFMLQGYGNWGMAEFDASSIINIVFGSLFVILIVNYFELSREEAGLALERQSRRLEEEHAMLDRYVIVCTFDLAGKIAYVSRFFRDISGYSTEEFTALNNSCGIDKEALKKIWSAIDSNEIWSGELMNTNKEGEHYWIRAVVEPVNRAHGEEPAEYRLIGEDITDRKRVEVLAISDYLTKLYNRVKLDDVLSKEISRAIRYKTTFCVILLDIDHFKKTNDSFGHQVGDTVLKKIARILQENIRKVDTAGRWGGEEFLIITPSTGIEGGVQFAEKLRTGVENGVFESTGVQTASFGVAEYREGDTIKSLIKRVDEALYRAKENGRNRVES